MLNMAGVLYIRCRHCNKMFSTTNSNAELCRECRIEVKKSRNSQVVVC